MTIDQVVKNLISLKDDQKYIRQSCNTRPYNPVVILYFGDKALTSKENIENKMIRIWKQRAKAILHLKYDNNTLYDANDLNELDFKDLQNKINELLKCDKYFENFNNILFCIIMNTADYSSIDDFKRGFESYGILKSALSQLDYKSINFILFDDSLYIDKNYKNEVKRYLKNTLFENIYYDSLFFLNSRMYSGVNVNNEELATIAGIIIVLINSIGDDYIPQKDLLYCTQNDYMLTPAYSYKKKPTYQIAVIMMRALFEKISVYLADGERYPVQKFLEKISNGRKTDFFIDDFFCKYINEDLLDLDLIEYLPRDKEKLASLELPMDFDLINCRYYQLKQIVDKTADMILLPKIKELCKNNLDKFLEYFENLILDQISLSDAKETFKEKFIDEFVQQFDCEIPQECLLVRDYYLKYAKYFFAKLVKQNISELLNKIQKKCDKCLYDLNSLNQELLDNYFINQTDLTLNYYKKSVDDYVEKKDFAIKLRKYLNFSKEDDYRNSILNCVAKTTLDIMDTNKVFSYSLSEEMLYRVGKEKAEINSIIQAELMESVSDRVLFRSIVSSLSLLTEFIIIDKADTIFSYLEEVNRRDASGIFLDSGNNNEIEVLRLYKCDLSLF